MSNLIPQWLWYLLRLAGGRQNAAKFEQWLYRAEPVFPASVYQDLLWLDYRKIAANPSLIMDWISEQRWFDADITRHLRGLTKLLQSGGKYPTDDIEEYLYHKWTQYLPVPPEYRQHLLDYLGEIYAIQDAIIHCYWGEPEENQLYLNVLLNDLNNFLDKLLMAVAAADTLPPVPEIPPYPQFPKN